MSEESVLRSASRELVLKGGVGAVVGAVFLWLFVRTDDRAASREQALLEAYREQTRVSVETVNSIRAYNKAVDANTEAIEANTEQIRELSRAADRAHEKIGSRD